jgi:PTS system nitrogen regulatory IIA component
MPALGHEIPLTAIRIFKDRPSKDAALRRLVADLAASDDELSDPEAVLTALSEREQVMSTGVGNGVAIPHVRIPGVSKPHLALGICPQGIEFDTLDDVPVQIVLVVVMPMKAHREYLQLLAKAMQALKTPGFRDALLAAADSREAAALCNA